MEAGEEALWEEGRATEEAFWSRQCSVGNLGSWHYCGCYFDTNHLPKDYCRLLFIAVRFAVGSAFFQQNNATCHTAKNVQECFEKHDKEFKVLPWPHNFPDLNPFEHLWDVLEENPD